MCLPVDNILSFLPVRHIDDTKSTHSNCSVSTFLQHPDITLYIPIDPLESFFIKSVLLSTGLSRWQTQHLNSSFFLHYPGFTPCFHLLIWCVFLITLSGGLTDLIIWKHSHLSLDHLVCSITHLPFAFDISQTWYSYHYADVSPAWHMSRWFFISKPALRGNILC